ncbi:MAG: ATP-grasp domain-containing protein [Clostridia bacterium]|nr:ATP-grasp domain-containing protein [Clostridia bacterium]
MKDKPRKRVLVAFGGRSCEHDISIITGVLVLNSLPKDEYEPLPVYITDSGWFTGEQAFDLAFFKGRDTGKMKRVVPLLGEGRICVLSGKRLKDVGEVYCAVNCLHGLNGEDGSFAGVMRMCNIPLSSPDMLASSVFMDKAASKVFLEGMGVPCLPYKVIKNKAFFQNRGLILNLTERQIGFPCIVKPARLGSSIGIKRASTKAELALAIEHALRYDGKIIVERALDGFVEINCAAFRSGGRVIVSECERPIASGDVLTFADKYKSGLTQQAIREFPANISEQLSRKIRDITACVYRKMGISGIVRMDFLLCNNEVYLNEVNTVPGSLALYLFKQKTSEYSELLKELIEEGVREHRDYESGTFTYPTDVLNGIGSKHCAAKRSTN